MESSKPARAACRWPAAGGFSLIEIMVAVALLAVIIVGLLAMFYQVQRAFRAGTAQADILEGGRATMGLLVRDLQDMAPSNFQFDTNCIVERSQYSPFVSPTSTQQLPSGNPRNNHLHDIVLLSRVNDDWVAVAYRIGSSPNGVGSLYRLVAQTNSATLPDVQSNNLNNLFSFARRASPDLDTNLFHRVIDGVVSLTITPYDTNGAPYVQNIPNPPNVSGATDLYGNTNDNLHVVQNADPSLRYFAFRSNALPAYLDIELAVLEPSALTKFRAREEIGAAQAAEYLARQIGRTHVFRQRVAIRPAATQIARQF